MKNIFKAPENIALRNPKKKSVFLAGSIEQGVAENWQEFYALEYCNINYNVFNPRRDEWDASWDQSYDSPQFYQQVNWELHAIHEADEVVVRFDSSTRSPITLMELGMCCEAKSAREAKRAPYSLYVICPEGFWRLGNVQMICSYYDVPLFENDDAFFDWRFPYHHDNVPDSDWRRRVRAGRDTYGSAPTEKE